MYFLKKKKIISNILILLNSLTIKNQNKLNNSYIRRTSNIFGEIFFFSNKIILFDLFTLSFFIIFILKKKKFFFRLIGINWLSKSMYINIIMISFTCDVMHQYHHHTFMGL